MVGARSGNPKVKETEILQEGEKEDGNQHFQSCGTLGKYDNIT